MERLFFITLFIFTVKKYIKDEEVFPVCLCIWQGRQHTVGFFAVTRNTQV